MNIFKKFVSTRLRRTNLLKYKMLSLLYYSGIRRPNHNLYLLFVNHILCIRPTGNLLPEWILRSMFVKLLLQITVEERKTGNIDTLNKLAKLYQQSYHLINGTAPKPRSTVAWTTKRSQNKRYRYAARPNM